MNYKVLYRKYRPQNFDELVGQDNIKDLLMKSVINKKISHAYVFTGPRGTGKTSTAKLFAKIINCEENATGLPCEKCSQCLIYNESPDIIEIDAASNNGVDEIRELRDNVKILPASSKYKIYIIDEVHMLSSSAWNAFLKTLEEPPHHVVFILATTEIQKVPITVLSRCQRFDFQRISDENIVFQINDICKKEKIKITSEAVSEIAKLSEGGMRDALGMVDQLSKLSCKIDLDTLKQMYGIICDTDIQELLIFMKNSQIEDLIKKIDSFKSNGTSATVLLNKLLDELLNEMIKMKNGGNCALKNIEEIITNLEDCYNKTNQYLLIKVILLKACEYIDKKIVEDIPNIVSIEENLNKDNNEEHKNDIIMPEKQDSRGYNDEIVQIRVNNSFVNANLDLKNDFKSQWAGFIDRITQNNEVKFLSIIIDLEVEVVSPTNVLFSTLSYSNSVLFNSQADEIIDRFSKEGFETKKFVCIDSENWKKEKEKYIKSLKTQKYEYITEPSIELDSPTIDLAEDLFGKIKVEIN